MRHVGEHGYPESLRVCGNFDVFKDSRILREIGKDTSSKTLMPSHILFPGLEPAWYYTTLVVRSSQWSH